MELNRLCLILPADIDEIEPADRAHRHRNRSTSSKNKHLRRRITNLIFYLRDQFLVLTGFSRYLPDKSYRHSQKFHDITGVVFSDKVPGNNPRIFSYAELYIGSNGFSPAGVLGSGGFGRVYKAVLPSDGTAVAVKCVAEKEERLEKTFAAELAAVARLRHRNLVRLRGWCVYDDQLLLVYDYMPNRSLDRILFHNHQLDGGTPLDWAQRWRIITGLAAALFYLHEQLDTQIIHRDVKTSNVMLDSGYNAKLGDFGLARWLEHELEAPPLTLSSSTNNYEFRLAEKTRIGGTIGYLPPENFQKRSVATAKSDVFGFGIVALEVASGRRAVDLSYPDEQIILLDWIRRLSDEGRCLQAGDKCLTDGSYPLREMHRLIHLGLLCSLHDPKSRPTMRWVLEVLSGDQFFELPPLPSFHLHPLYISLSSPTTSTANTTSTTTTTTTTPDSAALSNYVTANSNTMFATADTATGSRERSRSSNRSPNAFPVVDMPQEITFKEIVAATNNFSEDNVVAEMDFGTGYRGHLNNHQHVLVKRLGMKTCPALRMRFSNELQNLGRLRHRHLMQLRGWCTEQGEMLVVYDYLSRCLLSHLLFHPNHRNGENSVLRWRHRYNIVKSLASAVLYLHEEWEEQVIHRHITSSVVGLDFDMNPRLGGFALAEFLTRNEHGHHVDASLNTSVRGIFGYMAPEYMKSGEATTKADVYSFGVVVLEVVSGQMAVDFRFPEVLLVKKVQMFEARNRPLVELVDRRLDGEYNLVELQRLVRVGLACTRSDPELRPSMRQIVSVLDGHECLNPVMGLEHRRKSGRIDEWEQERMEEWEESNMCSLSMIKNIQALGIN